MIPSHFLCCFDVLSASRRGRLQSHIFWMLHHCFTNSTCMLKALHHCLSVWCTPHTYTHIHVHMWQAVADLGWALVHTCPLQTETCKVITLQMSACHYVPLCSALPPPILWPLTSHQCCYIGVLQTCVLLLSLSEPLVELLIKLCMNSQYLYPFPRLVVSSESVISMPVVSSFLSLCVLWYSVWHDFFGILGFSLVCVPRRQLLVWGDYPWSCSWHYSIIFISQGCVDNYAQCQNLHAFDFCLLEAMWDAAC